MAASLKRRKLIWSLGLGALVGPSQVGARAVEMVIARHHHPVWTELASTSLVAAGLVTLALVLYGEAGIELAR